MLSVIHLLINTNPEVNIVVCGKQFNVVVLLLGVDDDEVRPLVLPTLGPGRLPLQLVLVVIFLVAAALMVFPPVSTPGRGGQRPLTHEPGEAGGVRAELVSQATRGQQTATPASGVLCRVVLSPGGEVRGHRVTVQPPPGGLALSGVLQAHPPVHGAVRPVLANPSVSVS